MAVNLESEKAAWLVVKTAARSVLMMVEHWVVLLEKSWVVWSVEGKVSCLVDWMAVNLVRGLVAQWSAKRDANLAVKKVDN